MDGKTRDGKTVIGLQYKPRNDAGKIATFPIKGSIVVREKPRLMKYNIWTMEGKSELSGDDGYDLESLPDGLVVNPPVATDDEVIYFALTNLYTDLDGRMRTIIKRSGFNETRVRDLMRQYR
jgi:hypothetical protein